MNEELIITLNNGQSYKILAEGLVEDKKYCFAVLLTNDEKETEEYLFFEMINRDGKEIMKLVDNKETKEQLLVLFTAKYSQMVETLGGSE
ncbi:MAG: hypothetical protein E7169_03595 [Firmicutes bacterium]|nr:hypothetical protein [Bacillota bacterium]